MTLYYLITKKNNTTGEVNLKVSDKDDFSNIVDRKVIVPGNFTDVSTFVPTDITSYPQAIQDTINALWTVGVINNYKTAHPFGPTPADTPAQTRVKNFIADTNRQNLITQLLTATPAQIDNYIDANVTNLATATAMLKKIVKVLAINISQ